MMVQLRNCNLLFSPGTYPIQPLEDFSLRVHLDVKAAGYFLCLPSVMFDSFVTPWTVALQARLSMGFSRQE